MIWPSQTGMSCDNSLNIRMTAHMFRQFSLGGIHRVASVALGCTHENAQDRNSFAKNKKEPDGEVQILPSFLPSARLTNHCDPLTSTASEEYFSFMCPGFEVSVSCVLWMKHLVRAGALSECVHIFKKSRHACMDWYYYQQHRRCTFPLSLSRCK